MMTVEDVENYLAAKSKKDDEQIVADLAARWQTAERRLISNHRRRNLLCFVDALHSPSGFPRGIDGGQQ